MSSGIAYVTMDPMGKFSVSVLVWDFGGLLHIRPSPTSPQFTCANLFLIGHSRSIYSRALGELEANSWFTVQPTYASALSTF
jgi:hypothetical protein